MNSLTNFIRLAFVYSLASGLGCFAIFGALISIIKKGPRWFFNRKKREARPACMQDTDLGSHGFLRAQDVRLHYVAAGSCSKPLMLMIHGFPECWYSWRHQLKEFKRDYRVVALDMRGYCESEVLKGVHNYEMKKLVGDVKEVIAALGYSSCVLVAHDWGGAVAWTFAMDYPDLVDKLICMNIPHPHRFMEHISSSWRQMLKSWYMLYFQLPAVPEFLLSAGDYAFIAGAFKGKKMGLQLNRDGMSEDDLDAFKFGISQPGSFTAAINYYRATIQYPPKMRHNPTVTSPALLIWGDADGAFDNAVLDGHDKYVKNFTLKKVPGASHWVQQDDPEMVNKYMREFLGGKTEE